MTPRLFHASIVAVALVASACGDSAPQAATPTTTPAPTPTPVPVATPQAVFVCPLRAMPADPVIVCPKIQSQLAGYVSNAVDAVQRKQPAMFDFSDTRGDSVRVVDRAKYQTAVVAEINAQGGICAIDDNEEIALKINNDFNEQFNIWSSAGYTRRSYITTCFPAQF